ncbi:MAG: ABC transporter permease [Bacteroidia bacterium]
MRKIRLIILREYLTRVKKKSFIVMTLLGPLLMAAIFVVPIAIASYDTDEPSLVQVIDETKLFTNQLDNTSTIKFVYSEIPVERAKSDFRKEGYDGVLHIPSMAVNFWGGILYYSDKQANPSLIDYLQKTLQKEIEQQRLKAEGIEQATIDKIRTNVRINPIVITEQGETATDTAISMAVGLIGAFLIYIFIFIYGAQVMRGVMEEKTSRIVEVIISSVRPFQLMMGKIVGVAMVGLTQFVLWIILTFILFTAVSSAFVNKDTLQEKSEQVIRGQIPVEHQPQDEAAKIIEKIKAVPFGEIILVFMFYFIGGYLLYSALFAAVGSAVDSETDTQQFMLPVTVPLILSIVVAQAVIQNPDGSIALWFSMIPFTSPVIMMVRLPFGVPLGEILLSMAFLILGFLLTTWMAAKIYRTGILMYGKKITYRELGKWLLYKN